MWNYEKRLQYPVHITKCDPKAAMIIMSQYGGTYSITHELFYHKTLDIRCTVWYYILVTRKHADRKE